MSPARALLIACVAASAVAPAAAQDRRASFRVSAVVAAGCTVSSEAGGSWGRIDMGSIPGVGAGVASGSLVSGGVAGLVIGCTPETNASLTADAGENAASGQRRLRRTGGGATIPYQLRIGAAADAWNLQPVALAFPAGISRRTLPVSATTSLTGAVAAGTYSDTVRVTLTF